MCHEIRISKQRAFRGTTPPHPSPLLTPFPPHLSLHGNLDDSADGEVGALATLGVRIEDADRVETGPTARTWQYDHLHGHKQVPNPL